MKRNFSGKNEVLLREFLYINIMTNELYAEKICNSIKGFEINTALFNKVLFAKREASMPYIKEFSELK